MAKILVCDDDKEIVEAIEIYLSQEGHQILRAYDGEEALKILETERCGTSDHRCHDAKVGRNPCNTESSGSE